MLVIYLIYHYFIPHHSNNHKPKLLHPTSLIFMIISMIIYQFALYYFLPKTGIKILGYSANISIEEVVNLTNQKRAEAGLAPLQLNSTLSQAAQTKGTDMIERDYWAHVAPDGTEPWKFFIDSGYKYRYAGENLARDFSNAPSAVDAWMASPTHKENMLSPKYKEIGIAVVEGDLNGVDTTIIVQLFGSTYADVSSTPLAQNQPGAAAVSGVEEEVEVVPTSSGTPIPVVSPIPKEAIALVSPVSEVTLKPEIIQQAPVAALETQSEEGSQVLISPFVVTKTVSLVVVGILLAILVIDAIIVSKRRIARVGGRAFAHISFMGMILVIAMLLRAGRIL